MSWIKKFLSKKLLAFILTPLLMGVLMAINKFLGGLWTDDQMNAIINKVLEALIGYLVAQGAVDVAKAVKSNSSTDEVPPELK